MKLSRLDALLVVELALLSSGCASLSPPATDREAWEGQQKQEEAERKSALWGDPAGLILSGAYGLGYALGSLAK
jgi:hypothetical protein